MSKITVTRAINASVEKVFDTVAHIDGFSKALTSDMDAVKAYCEE
jgi:hypothetical protein